jgi:hypothetical protein
MATQEKVRITIRLDADLLAHFKSEAAQTVRSEDPIGYQGLINEALREYIETEKYLRHIIDTGNHSVIDPQNPPPWWQPG